MIRNYFINQSFTGFKDKNGELIYERDIIKYKNSNFEIIGAWYNRQTYIVRNFYWEAYNHGKILDLSKIISECEVIGNSYDNPELC